MATPPPSTTERPVMREVSGRLPRRTQRPRRWRWLIVVAVVVVLIAAGVAFMNSQTAAPPPTATPTVAPRLIARGKVQPAAQARVATLGGGVVRQLPVAVGQAVAEGQELARVRSVDGASEVLTAPWAGTVTAIPVHLGDTVTAGTIVATIGDLHRLQIETTDLDEFLIGKVFQGQPVTVTIDALDGRQWQGYVRSVTLQPQTGGTIDEHYPVIIDLVGSTDDLRPGMSARINFALGNE